MKKYLIKPLLSFVKDEDSVDFHAVSDDYFGTIATVVSLIRQNIENDKLDIKAINVALKNLEKDLVYLQKNYRICLKEKNNQIIPKIKNKNKVPKGKLKSQ